MPLTSSHDNAKSAWCGLLVRREVWAFSWWAKLGFIVVVLALICSIVFWALYPFLAPNQIVTADYVVAEGWIPAYALNEARELYQRGGYRKLLTCGALVPGDWATNSVSTYAEWGASKLARMGMPRENVLAIPAGEVHVDRTYAAAVAVRDWLKTNAEPVRAINIVTLGPHGRRSRLLFEKAMGDAIKVGIVSVPDRSYRGDRWWQTSEGVREVLSESIAYLYARFFFSPTNHDRHSTHPKRQG